MHHTCMVLYGACMVHVWCISRIWGLSRDFLYGANRLQCGTGGMDLETTMTEDNTYFRILVKFATLIHIDVSIKTITIAGEVLLKKISNEVEGCSFRYKAFSDN